MENARDENGRTLDEFLKEYDVSVYERPSVTVDMAVFTVKETKAGKKMAILLIKRRNHPSIGKYALPGGFVEMDESVSEAAKRELLEETGVEGVVFRQFGTFGDLDRDPRTRVISVGHYAAAPMGTLDICAGDDALEAELFDFSVSRCGDHEYRIRLSGSVELEYKAALKRDGFGYVMDGADSSVLASDHGKVLFAALCALANHKKEDTAALLVSEKLDFDEALKVVEEALGQLPQCANIGL